MYLCGAMQLEAFILKATTLPVKMAHVFFQGTCIYPALVSYILFTYILYIITSHAYRTDSVYVGESGA